jgi:hypothetical protein
MNTRDLLQQALDALKTSLDCAREIAADTHEKYAGYKPHRHAAVDKDVTDIEAAIAAIEAELAKLQAEAVGYAYEHQDYIGSVIGAKGEYAPHEIPLFTHPAPTIEPLSDEEILALEKQTPAMNDAGEEWIYFARAIEAAIHARYMK